MPAPILFSRTGNMTFCQHFRNWDTIKVFFSSDYAETDVHRSEDACCMHLLLVTALCPLKISPSGMEEHA
jgi:hypothetical protein